MTDNEAKFRAMYPRELWPFFSVPFPWPAWTTPIMAEHTRRTLIEFAVRIEQAPHISATEAKRQLQAIERMLNTLEATDIDALAGC
jgi:hypothetical protein